MKKRLILSMALALAVTLWVAALAAADVLDPGFESGAFAPNWTTGFGLRYGALTGSAPYTGADVPAFSGGGVAKTWVLGGPLVNPLTQIAIETNSGLLYPAYGHYSAKINDETTQYHANWITQTFTIDAGNLDSVDGLYHLRMVVAPVLQAAGHTAPDQPFFWVRVTNNSTGGTILYDDVFVPGDPGIPWLTGNTGWVYLNWVLIDVNTGMNNGNSVTVQITAADCDAGGHGGYALVDAIGGSIPGPTITATGIATTPENTDITYTFTYKNGSGASAGLTPTVNLPPGTTFVSQSGCGGSGPVTCTFPAVPAGGSGTFMVTVHVPTGTAGTTVTEGNYNIAGSGFPTLTGPAVFTDITAVPTPTLLNLAPPHGPITGGTTATINGTGLTGGTFTFGGSAAACTVNGAGIQATCTTPAHIVGLVDVVVTAPGGTATLANSFTFDPTPVAIPSTGFAPDRITVLAAKTTQYKDLGDLSLEIPRLGVQVPIVGVPQANGTWDISWLGSDAGWLEGSAFPTWAGNSVVTGHIYDAYGQPGPFRYLNTLKWADKVIVHAGGAQYVYEVRSVSQVRPGDVSAMMKHEELPWITLVTCQGYDEASNSYKNRVLVRAVLVEVK